MSNCRFGVSPVNYPDPETKANVFEEFFPFRSFLKSKVRFVQVLLQKSSVQDSTLF